VQNEIVMQIRASPGQFERERGLERYWREPLAAFAPAGDRRFLSLKKQVSPSHLLPEDLLPGARGVICFFIPFHERIIEGNAEGAAASREWAEAYLYTNELIARISRDLGGLLAEGGFGSALIPATHNFDEERLVSDWSHRHVAHIAGLGSFGINNMLITEKGCCGRFGSLVTGWAPEPAVSPGAEGAAEYCLHRRKGGCGLCQKRCPAGAYRDGVFNRRVCYDRCLENARLHRAAGFADVCGKCLCGLPCSASAPP
jgi:epoxyqueuosine reductase QueG